MSSPFCPLCDVRMVVLDGKFTCRSCGHTRPIHRVSHRIGLRCVLLGAGLLLAACGGAVAVPATADPVCVGGEMAASQPFGPCDVSKWACPNDGTLWIADRGETHQALGVDPGTPDAAALQAFCGATPATPTAPSAVDRYADAICACGSGFATCHANVASEAAGIIPVCLKEWSAVYERTCTGRPLAGEISVECVRK